MSSTVIDPNLDSLFEDAVLPPSFEALHARVDDIQEQVADLRGENNELIDELAASHDKIRKLEYDLAAAEDLAEEYRKRAMKNKRKLDVVTASNRAKFCEIDFLRKIVVDDDSE